MTSFNSTRRLIISDVIWSIVPAASMKSRLEELLPKLSSVIVEYDENVHASLFVDYDVETKQLEIQGFHTDFKGDVSYDKDIAPSYLTSARYIVDWIRQQDIFTYLPKTESYDVF